MLMLKQLTLYNDSDPLAYKLEDGHLMIWCGVDVDTAPADSVRVDPDSGEHWQLRAYLASSTEAE